MTDRALRRLHLAWGWTALAVWVVSGLGLEVLHGFKVGWLLDADVTTRRTMLRLAHAHGALTGVVNIAFAVGATGLAWGDRGPARASKALRAGTVLLPGGFLLGGLWIHDGDPGLGVLAAPIGGVLLCGAIIATARAALRVGPVEPGGDSE